jgi:hypothetical protein
MPSKKTGRGDKGEAVGMENRRLCYLSLWHPALNFHRSRTSAPKNSMSARRESDIEQSTIDQLSSLNRWSMAELNWDSGKGGDGRSLFLSCPITIDRLRDLQNYKFGNSVWKPTTH